MYKIIGGDQKEYGPVPFEGILEWIRGNQANAQTLIQKEGGPWVPLGSLPEFAAHLPSAMGAGPSPAGPSPSGFGTGGGAGGVTPSMGTSGGASGAGGGFGGGGLPPYSGLGGGDPEQIRQLVSGPATALLVTGIVCLILSILGLIANLTGAGFQPPPGEIPPEMEQFFEAMKHFQGPVAVVTSILSIAISGLIMYAGQRMRLLRSYTLVVTAAILAIVPCISPCCCIGIPVGIWVLVILFKPEVKAAFQ